MGQEPFHNTFPFEMNGVYSPLLVQTPSQTFSWRGILVFPRGTLPGFRSGELHKCHHCHHTQTSERCMYPLCSLSLPPPSCVKNTKCVRKKNILYIFFFSSGWVSFLKISTIDFLYSQFFCPQL